ncbi:hypothetical protein IJH15_00415 [Candidatus Saccharibacteria bacterium]|nr:hypothetical protein [Candidatus Saccharibacteria bacterium]MBQ3464675.1 hypothetical protein [Candidatus Saccharibacteria bacterium]MBQ6313539.1 hypothetical protein [Candidatus Saccharibacteria bacterium]
MLKIFYGEDRIRAKNEIERILGNDYEVIEGPELDPTDLPNIFLGTSLLSDERKILIRDLSENRSAFEKLPDYLSTPHKTIIFETKLDKRSATYKLLKDKIEIKEFPARPDPNANLVFGIYNTAKRNGKKAIEDLEKIKPNQDPMMFFGLLVSQALRDFQQNQGTKEKKALKELSKLDLDLKSSKLSSWLLIESFLLRLSSF